MPKQKVTVTRKQPAGSVADEVTPAQNGRSISPEAAELMAEMAARGRARRQQVEVEGSPLREDKRNDPEWQQRWDDLLARVRREIPDGLTPEEIEAEITRAAEEVRAERLARGR